MILVLLLAFLAILISFVFAYLSMSDYQEYPAEALKYSLFLINARSLDKVLLNSLHLQTPDVTISFEKLLKGGAEATVLYGPRDLISSMVDLQPKELEDYTKKYGKKAFCWELVREGSKRRLLPQKTHGRVYLKPLKGLSLKEDEQVWFQIVTRPHQGKKDSLFQTTARLVVVTEDPARRSDLVRMVDNRFKAETDLIRKKTSMSSSQVYNSYKKRSFIPSEIMDFKLSTEQLLNLLS